MENFQQTLDTLNRIVFDSDEPVVVALCGSWGVGKTYFWKNAVMPNEGAGNSIYVSVFGAASIQEIRERVIFEAIRRPRFLPSLFGKQFGKASSILQITRSWLLKIPIIGWILVWLVKTFATILSGLLFRWPELIHAYLMPTKLNIQYFERGFLKKGLIICLDDVERLPASVPIENLVGYINELKDDFRTKVILIYNEEKLAAC